MVHVLVAIMGMPWRRYVEGFRSLLLDDNAFFLLPFGSFTKTIVIVQETAFAKVPIADYRSMLLAVEDVYREFLKWQGVKVRFGDCCCAWC
jgi:hypothetical protein